MSQEIIRVAHSPDSDDAFMFYALATNKIDTGEFKFIHELKDIETLNQAALEGIYEISAISIHAYAYLYRDYALLNCGASMGEGYGPKLVCREQQNEERLAGKLVAVPGNRTSAYLALKLFEPDCQTLEVPFDRIVETVQEQKVDAGVIIHEGQLSYREYGLRALVDLGQWWKKQTNLPLPLGGNVVRKDLGEKRISRLSALLRASIRFAIENRQQALDYALQFGRGLDREQADSFVGMYVNQRTLDYKDEGRRAVQLFLDRGFEAGLIPERVAVQFVA